MEETFTKAHVKLQVTGLTEELNMALRHLAHIIDMVHSLSLLVYIVHVKNLYFMQIATRTFL